ncbi:coronin-2B [Chanos chanos]|uniref:Coronin n=1 Tax=Chanos chanos TaxID=29144 RepID=A0A6J2VFW4_CHACN|nr:coronin-2B-like [Chanos chanos]
MSWHPPYRRSKFRHVYGKPASKENCYDGLSITRSVHDNLFCSVNPRFIAVVTECAGGGAFLVISIHHRGRVDPHHPRVCGHSGRVLDIKWDPFNDQRIASCSEDCTVKVWDIPGNGVKENITIPRKELRGHTRRVNLVQWHPTAKDVLFSSAYDYKVLVWRLDTGGLVMKTPVCVISVHSDLVLSMCLHSDGTRLATSCKDKRIRIIDPRTGKLLQESCCKSHRPSKVVFLENHNMLLSTGTSQWNQRQFALWDTDDLSVSLLEEDLDGGSGVLFPFYDPDLHMLYLAGKGDGNIRYYEVASEKPYIHFLAEYRSPLPQRGLAVMPKRGLDMSACEVYRFYRLVTTKDLVEPLSFIVPRRSEGFQEDIYPMTAGNEASMTAQEWLMGQKKGPVLLSLKPETKILNPYPAPVEVKRLYQHPHHSVERAFLEEQLAYQDAKYTHDIRDLSGWQEDETQTQEWTNTYRGNTLSIQSHKPLAHSELHWCESAVYIPPPGETELLQVFYRQQEEIRRLRQQLDHKDERIRQLELEIRNLRNYMRASF